MQLIAQEAAPIPTTTAPSTWPELDAAWRAAAIARDTAEVLRLARLPLPPDLTDAERGAWPPGSRSRRRQVSRCRAC